MLVLIAILLALILIALLYGWPKEKRLAFLNLCLKLSAATVGVIGILTAVILGVVVEMPEAPLSNRVVAIPFLVFVFALILLTLAKREGDSPKETIRHVGEWVLVGALVLLYMWWNPPDWNPLHLSPNPLHLSPGMFQLLHIAVGIVFCAFMAYVGFAWVLACMS